MIKLKDILFETEYRGLHTAPTKENGAPLHDLTKIYPDDIYSSQAARIYGDMGGDDNDIVSVHIMQSYRNKPNAKVKIYRAVPNINKEINGQIKYYSNLIVYVNRHGFPPINDTRAGVIFSELGRDKQKYITKLSDQIDQLEFKKQKRIGINSGDWVTLNINYARNHGLSELRGNYKIVTKTVSAKHLYTDANSVHEFGYDPS